MEQFITVMAWVFGVGNVVVIVLKLICAHNYTELQKMLDIYKKGGYKTFPIKNNLIVLVICACWLISNGV